MQFLLGILHIFLLLTSVNGSPYPNMNPKKFFAKAKESLHGTRQAHLRQSSNATQPSNSTATTNTFNVPAANAQDILKFRYHHGVNLGSLFVLEKWLTPSMFSNSTTTGIELAALEASVNETGIDATREKWEAHWRDWVTDQNIEWLVREGHGTTVRIPIAYYTLGADFVKGTPYEPYAEIFTGAIPILGGLIERLREQGIGVIIDFHALPGGSNADNHSGSTTGEPLMWTTPKDRALAAAAISQMARYIAWGHFGDAVVGLQIVNEAVFNAPNMYKWYDAVVSDIREINPGVPIYVSDGWNLNRATKWARANNKIDSNTDYDAAFKISRNPIIVDTHLYWCFTAATTQMSPQEIIADVPSKLGAVTTGKVMDQGALGAIVGEYSDVIGESSWEQSGNQSRHHLTVEFGQAQSDLYQDKSMGSFFWTWKMEWMPGGSWGFVEQTKMKAITAPEGLLLDMSQAEARIEGASPQKESRMTSRATAHEQYWKKHAARTTSDDFWLYWQGFNQGWFDAATFFAARSQGWLLLRTDLGGGEARQGADVIGGVDLWILKRLVESGTFKSSGAWQYEHGMREGIKEFRAAVGL